jgi:hypothetical protein
MALYKTTTLTLVLQVERKGEASEQRAIWPSPRIFTEVLLTLVGANRGKWRVCQAEGNFAHL